MILNSTLIKYINFLIDNKVRPFYWYGYKSNPVIDANIISDNNNYLQLRVTHLKILENLQSNTQTVGLEKGDFIKFIANNRNKKLQKI